MPYGHHPKRNRRHGKHGDRERGYAKKVTQSLLELTLRLGLFRAHAACGDFRPEIILTPHGAARQAAQHGDLANVGKGIGDGTLKQPFHGTGERRLGSKPLVESFQRGKKASRSLLPRERRGIVPSFFALREGKRPIEQVAEVSQDLGGCASGLAGAKPGEFRGRATQRFAPSIGERGQRMAQQNGFAVVS